MPREVLPLACRGCSRIWLQPPGRGRRLPLLSPTSARALVLSICNAPPKRRWQIFFFFFFCSAISILHGACSRATHVHSLPVLCPVAAPSQGTRGVLLHPLVEQCARSLWGFSIHCLFIKKKPFCLPKRSCLLACCALGQLDPSQSVMQPSGKLHPPTAQLFPLKQPRALPLARRSCLGRAKWVKEPSR